MPSGIFAASGKDSSAAFAVESMLSVVTSPLSSSASAYVSRNRVPSGSEVRQLQPAGNVSAQVDDLPVVSRG